MRNNNKPPKSGNDRSLGKGKFGEKGRTADRGPENERRDFRKEAGGSPTRHSGKPDFSKPGKVFGVKPATDSRSRGFDRKDDSRPYRSSGDREEKRPYRTDNRADSGSRGSDRDRPYRSSGDREERRPRTDNRADSGSRGNDRTDRPYRSSGDREEKRPYRTDNRADSGSRGNDRADRTYRSSGDREERRPRTDNRTDSGSRESDRADRPYRSSGDREERRPRTDNRTGSRSASPGDKKVFSPKGDYRSDNDEKDFRPAYEPKFKKKDFGDKNKRDYFERKNSWEEKADREGNTFEKNKPAGKFAKPGVNKRQHNPSGKAGSPRYKFDKDGPKPAKSTETIRTADNDDANTIRLNRYISNAGICSRREADDLIATGQITVNGKVMTEMGYQVKKSDTVKYGKKILNPEKLIYVLMNKPKDYITTMEDPENRKTVMDLLEGAFPERVYPVGRLDRNTTGLLLLTNDGEMADKLTHPSYNTRKIYQAELDKPFTVESFEKLKEGVELEDGFIKPDEVAIITPDAYVVGIEIHSGKNRVVRRIFESLGYDVKKLDRTVFANLNKRDLPRGKWRYLSEKEVIGLKFLS